jgi:CheY-like chemotaxis protein
MEKSKVLIVEDDNLTRNFLSEIILSFGYDVESCNNGEEAIVQIKDI